MAKKKDKKVSDRPIQLTGLWDPLPKKKLKGFDAITHETERDNAHHSSERIISQLTVITCEEDQAAAEAQRISGRLVQLRARQKHLRALKAGLDAILEKR